MYVLGNLAGRHDRVDACNTELAVAEVAEEGTSGVDEDEYSEGGQRKVEGPEVELHLDSWGCNNLGPDDKGGVSCPETVEV